MKQHIQLVALTVVLLISALYANAVTEPTPPVKVSMLQDNTEQIISIAAPKTKPTFAVKSSIRERVARPNLQMNPTQLKSIVNGSQADKASRRTKQSGLFYTRPQGTLWRSWGKDDYGYGSSVIMAPGMVDQTYLNQSSGRTMWTMVNSSGEDISESAGVAKNVDANNNYVTNINPKRLYYTPVINKANRSDSWSLSENSYYYKTGETDRVTDIMNDSLTEVAPFDDHGWSESDGEIYGGRYGWGSLSTDNLYGSGYLTDSETGAPYAVCEGVQIVLGKLAAPLYVEDIYVGGLSLSGTPIAEGDTLKLEITNVAYLHNGNPCAGDHVFETLYAVSCDTLDFRSTSTRNGKTVYSGKVVFSKKTYNDIGWEIVEPFVLNADSMYALRLTGFATEDHEMNENIDFGLFGYQVADEDMPHHLGRNYPDSAITSFSFFPCYYYDEDVTYYHYYSGLAADFHLTAMFDACEVQAEDSLNVIKMSDDGTEMTPIYASEENQDITCILANTTTYVFDPYDEEIQYYSLMIDTITGGDWITGVHFAEQWREDENTSGGHEQIYFQAEPLPADVKGRYAILYLQSNRTGVRSKNPIILLQGNATLDDALGSISDQTSHPLTIKTTGNGTATFNGTEVRNGTSTFSVASLSTVKIAVKPDEFNHIESVLINGTAAQVLNDTLTISNIADSTGVEIVFAQSSTILAITAEGAGTVSVDNVTVRGGSKSLTVNAGTRPILTIQPDAHQRVDSLTVNGVSRLVDLSEEGTLLLDSMLAATSVYVRFSQIYHTLTLSSSAYGRITYTPAEAEAVIVTDSEQQFAIAEGSPVNLTITPDAGYHLGDLTLNGESIADKLDAQGRYTIADMEQDVTVSAVFGQTFHPIVVKATGNGTATFNGTEVRNGTSTFSVASQSTAKIAVKPDEFNYIESILVNGTAAQVLNDTLTISNIADSTGVEIVFAQSSTTLAITAEGAGTVSVDNVTVRGGSKSLTVIAGTRPVLTVLPDAHQRVDSLTVNGVSRLAELSGEGTLLLDSMLTATSVYVRFAQIYHTLTLNSTQHGQIIYVRAADDSLSISNGQRQFSVAEGANVPLVVRADEGYHLLDVTLNGGSIANDLDAQNRYTIADMEQDVTISAIFGQTIYPLVITTLGNGAATYNATEVRNSTSAFSVAALSIVKIAVKPDEYHHIESVLINGTAAQVLNDTLTISNIADSTGVDITFAQTYHLLTLATDAHATVSYEGIQVTGGVHSVNIAEGEEPIVTISVQAGFQIAQVTLNDDDITDNIAEGGIVKLHSMTADTRLSVTTEQSFNTFALEGMSFGVISMDEGKAMLLSIDDKTFADIPAQINYGNVMFMVTQVADTAFTACSSLISVSLPATISEILSTAFANCPKIAAIDWQANTQLQLQGIANPNLLVYVNAEQYAPEGVQNVVVGGVCERLVLTDKEAFHAPRAFTARHAEYVHEYTLETPAGANQGWETLTLPFTVQAITHETNGALAPFAALTGSNDPRKPFWLYGFGTDGEIFVKAAQVEAYKPYLIAMPNSYRYKSQYIQAGLVTFSAENVEVEATPYHTEFRVQNYCVLPTMQRVAKARGVYALNTGGEDFRPAGSVFISDSRDVLPFECYVTLEDQQNAPRLLPVWEMMDGSTAIEGVQSIVNGIDIGGKYHDLGGRRVVERTDNKKVNRKVSRIVVGGGKKHIRRKK